MIWCEQVGHLVYSLIMIASCRAPSSVLLSHLIAVASLKGIVIEFAPRLNLRKRA